LPNPPAFLPAYVSIRQHTPQHTSYASTRLNHLRFYQHTTAYTSIRQHTSYASIRHTPAHQHTPYASIHKHTPAYVICQHRSYASIIRQHTSYASIIRQHMSYASVLDAPAYVRCSLYQKAVLACPAAVTSCQRFCNRCLPLTLCYTSIKALLRLH
jgi:hypothetical protein